MNTAQLIERTRDLLDMGESAGSGPTSDAEVLRTLNNALDWIYGHQIRMQPLSLVQVSTLSGLGITSTTTIGESLLRVTLPEYVARIIQIEDSSFNALDFTSNLADFGGRNRSISASADRQLMDLPFQGIVGNGNDLIFRGSQTVSLSHRIWYVHRPPALARFTATGGSTTTITLEVNEETAVGRLVWRPSYYVGGYVEVTESDEAIPFGDIRRISASARGASYPDMTLTVDAAFSATISAGDTIDMIPQLDPLFHELPCYYAASRIADKLGDPVTKGLLREHAQQLFEQWQALLGDRQSASPSRAFRTK